MAKRTTIKASQHVVMTQEFVCRYPCKRRSTGKVTIADVAQLAGVGTMTVSRALRTPWNRSDKLREKIEAAVHELGYML